jgi:hypothetical protein
VRHSRARTTGVTLTVLLGLLALLASAALGSAGPVSAAAPGDVVVSDNDWCTQGIASTAGLATGAPLIGSLLDPEGAGLGTPPFNPAAAATARLGASTAIYSYYVNWRMPGDAGPGVDQWGFLNTLDDGVAHMGGIFGLTLALTGGVGTDHVNAQTVQPFVDKLKIFNTVNGTPVLLRIGPEMNGNWSPWDLQPLEFVRAFRLIADMVHAQAPATQVVWSPAFGAGYPWGFHGTADEQAYITKHGQQDYDALDTNHDGHITIADDPYSPYWPGAQYVDWVGMSLYHFGTYYPWGKDVLPPAGEFAGELRGTYHPTYQPMTASDFYGVYAKGFGKPVMMSETGAWFTPDTANYPGAASEQAIKTAWWDQIVAALAALPRLKAIVFFDAVQDPAKVTEPGSFSPPLTTPIQWQFDRTPQLVAAFLAHFPANEFRYAPGNPCYAGGTPLPTPAPTVVPPVTQPPVTQPPDVAAPTPSPAPEGVLALQTVCTTKKQAALLHGHQKVTRVTRVCVRRQVRVRWTTGPVCTVRTTTSKDAHGKVVARRDRTCRIVPIPVITPVRVLQRTTAVSYLDARGRRVRV